jgi:hypothetical protein
VKVIHSSWPILFRLELWVTFTPLLCFDAPEIKNPGHPGFLASTW